MEIMKIVKKLKSKHKTSNPFELAHSMGFIIVITPLGQETRGFYQYFKRNKIIYINSSLSYKDSQFVCAHEIAHAVFHKKSNVMFLDTRTFLKTNHYELEANEFATLLLIPDNELIEHLKNGYTLENIASIYGYDKSLIELRLKYLK